MTAQRAICYSRELLRPQTTLLPVQMNKRNGQPPVPFMNWQTHQPTLCAAQLINRFPDLVSFANAHYHGVPQMCHRWATHIRTKANNERATQIRSIKQTWLSSQSKYALAYTYTPEPDAEAADTSEDTREVFAVTESVSESGINDVGIQSWG